MSPRRSERSLQRASGAHKEPAQLTTGALVRSQKPWEMSPDERVAEMGEILAAGYRRKVLADAAPTERPCDQTVNTKEVA